MRIMYSGENMGFSKGVEKTTTHLKRGDVGDMCSGITRGWPCEHKQHIGLGSIGVCLFCSSGI